MDFLDHDFADMMFLVESFVRIALFDRGIPSNGRNINHPSSELDKGSPDAGQLVAAKRDIPFDGNFQVCDVMEAEIDEVLVLLFSQMVNESLSASTTLVM